MLAIVRVRVWLKETSKRGVITLKTGNLQMLWDYIREKYKDWNSGKCRVVYLTHRELKEDISLFIQGEDMSDISEFVRAHIAPMKCVRSIRLIGLMNPRFFPVPKETPQNLKRFTIAISCEPQFLTKTYGILSSYKATKSVVPNYLAYTLGGKKGDLLASYSCRGETTLKRFVDRYIRPLEGVIDTRITRISRTKRLASRDEWRKLFEQYVNKEGLDVEEMEEFEDDWIAGC